MKKNKKRNAPPPPTPPTVTEPQTPATDKKALLRMLLIHAVLIIGLYFLAAGVGIPYISLLYVLVAAGLAVGYLIYNRGFAYRGVREEDLSDKLSQEEKRALLFEVRERDRKSKWVLTLLLPIVVAVLLDLLYLYLLPGLEGLF